MLTQFNAVFKIDEDIVSVINKPMTINKEDIEKKVWLYKLTRIELRLENILATTEDESLAIRSLKEFENENSQFRVEHRKRFEKSYEFTESKYEDNIKEHLFNKKERVNVDRAYYKQVQENTPKDLLVIRNIIQNLDRIPINLLKLIATSGEQNSQEPGDFAKWVNEELKKYKREIIDQKKSNPSPSEPKQNESSEPDFNTEKPFKISIAEKKSKK